MHHYQKSPPLYLQFPLFPTWSDRSPINIVWILVWNLQASWTGTITCILLWALLATNVTVPKTPRFPRKSLGGSGDGRSGKFCVSLAGLRLSGRGEKLRWLRGRQVKPKLFRAIVAVGRYIYNLLTDGGNRSVRRAKGRDSRHTCPMGLISGLKMGSVLNVLLWWGRSRVQLPVGA